MREEVLTVRRLEPWIGREMASRDLVEHFTRPTTLKEDPHPSEILRTRSEPRHRGLELYDHMLEKDPDVAAYLCKRSDAVLALPRRIVAREESPEAREVAEFCHLALGRITGFRINLEHQWQAVSHGIAFEELLWEQLSRGPLAGAWVPVEALDRPAHRFLFRQGQLHVRRSGREAEVAPAGKFLVSRQGTKDSPWGKGLLDQLYWHWYLKRHAYKFWAVFVEKWAQPTAIGKYTRRRGDGDQVRQANQKSQKKLLGAIEGIQTEYGIVIPEDLQIELLEAQRSGNVSYEGFVNAINRTFANRILGEVNTSGLRPGVGAFASDKVSQEIRREKVIGDAAFLSAHLTETLLTWIVQLNFGAEAAIPRFHIEAVEADDRPQRREGIAMALDRGEPVPKRYFDMTLQIPAVLEGEPLVLPQPTQILPKPPEVEASLPRTTTPLLPGSLHLATSSPPGTVLAQDRLLSAMAAEFRGEITGYFEEHRQVVLQAWEERESQWEILPRVVDQLDPTKPARVLQAALVHGMGAAFQTLLEEGLDVALLLQGRAGLGRLDLPLRSSPSLHLMDEGSWREHRTGDAAADYWARVLNLPRQIFDDLSDLHRRFAFTAAGVTEGSLLLQIQELTERAITEGWSRQRFREELEAAYGSHGVTPTSSWHADLILNQAVRQANGSTRYRSLVLNPAARRLFPYLQFWSLGDDRVRARPEHNHQVMHGLIFAIEHEIWRTWWYPAGFECRCYVSPISRRQAERLGLLGSEPTGAWPLDSFSGERALPDPGFRSAPDLERLLGDRLQPQVLDHAREARSRGDSGLIAALRRLIERLLGFDPFALLGLSARPERRLAMGGGAP